MHRPGTSLGASSSTVQAPVREFQKIFEVLPQEMHSTLVPATRTFVLRRTSKTILSAGDNAKVDVVVVRRSGVKFRNGEGLLVLPQHRFFTADKLNGLNAWCRVTELPQ